MDHGHASDREISGSERAALTGPETEEREANHEAEDADRQHEVVVHEQVLQALQRADSLRVALFVEVIRLLWLPC